MIFDTDVLIWFLRGNENAWEKVLCTANDKHYKFIPGLELDIFRP